MAAAKKIRVTAPVADFTGEVAGVRFADGVAVVDPHANAAALAYFRRRGYGVTAAGRSAAALDQGDGTTPPTDPGKPAADGTPPAA